MTLAHYCAYVLEETISFPKEENASDFSDRSDQGWGAVRADLLNWMSEPSLIADEDGLPASKMAIRIALQWAIIFERNSLLPPLTVVPDGNGGIAFEWQEGRFSRWVEISSKGRTETIVIRDGAVVMRQTL